MKILDKYFTAFPGESPVFPLAMLIQGLLFMLGLWGCLAIYNATMYAVSPFYFVGRQLLWLVLGMGLMMLCARIPFSIYRDNVELLTVLFYIRHNRPCPYNAFRCLRKKGYRTTNKC